MADKNGFEEIGSLFRDLFSIKNEIVQEVTGVGKTLKEAKESISEPLESAPKKDEAVSESDDDGTNK